MKSNRTEKKKRTHGHLDISSVVRRPVLQKVQESSSLFSKVKSLQTLSR